MRCDSIDTSRDGIRCETTVKPARGCEKCDRLSVRQQHQMMPLALAFITRLTNRYASTASKTSELRKPNRSLRRLLRGGLASSARCPLGLASDSSAATAPLDAGIAADRFLKPVVRSDGQKKSAKPVRHMFAQPCWPHARPRRCEWRRWEAGGFTHPALVAVAPQANWIPPFQTCWRRPRLHRSRPRCSIACCRPCWADP